VAGRRETYVALLRGINLGSRNRVSMPELRTLFEALGAEDVSTYVQSGNVVFRSSERAGELEKSAAKRIAKDLGVDVTVLVRSGKQLAKLVSGNPFTTPKRDPKTLHVTFLAETPPAARVRELDPAVASPDEFRVVGQDVYLLCPNGYGRSKLSNAFFEKRLGVAATTRNWKSVTALAELAS
jgi:uncharacterized protein (DUF1697 family)